MTKAKTKTPVDLLADAIAAKAAKRPNADAELRYAARAVQFARDEHHLVELPADLPLGSRDLVRAVVTAKLGTDETPEGRAIFEALVNAEPRYLANEARRLLVNADRALRELTVGYARLLRDLHEGHLPRPGSGFDQSTRELATASAQLHGLLDGLVASTFAPLQVERPEEPKA